MSDQVTIFSFETAPGDLPVGIEQPNGDLLLPSGTRCVIELVLLQVELALIGQPEMAALDRLRALLNIDQPKPEPSWLSNLNKIRPI